MSQSQEYVVRVPRETKTKKRFNVMRFSAALKVDVTNWKSGRLERENNIKEFKGSNEELPKFGAGSEFGRELKEEARRKKYGIATKKYNPDDQPWILKVKDNRDGKDNREGRKFKGIREGGVSENTSYYVFFQAHDGAFEAFPVSEWYNFVPIPKYKALTAEEAEEKFIQRGKILNYFSIMATKKKQDTESGEGVEEKLVKKKKKDFKVSDMDDWHYDSDNSGVRSDASDEDKKPTGKALKKGKGKKKKKKGSDDDNDSEPMEDSDEGDFDQREVDYMSSSSEEEVEDKSERALKGVEDEDALRQLVISEDEDEDEEEKNEEEKKFDPNSEKSNEESKKSIESEMKAKIKQEKDDSKSESSASSEDSDDSDFDDSKFQSAMFMQKKVQMKSKNGSDSNSSSKPNTPLAESSSTDDKESEKQTKSSVKRKLLGNESSPASSKKAKTIDSNSSNDGITEEAVKRYLMRKPMTTTELLQKFKSKRIPMTGTDFMTTIAQILKKLNPEKQTINGKLYLSIKPS